MTKHLIRTHAVAGIIAAAGMVAPLVALAQFIGATSIGSFCDIVKTVNTAAQWFAIVVFIIAAAAILYSALLFFTAGGNEEAQSKAKKVLVYGVIGVAIALLATFADDIVAATIGGKGFSPANCVIIPSGGGLIP